MRILPCLATFAQLFSLMALPVVCIAAQPQAPAAPLPSFTTRIEFTVGGDGEVRSAKLMYSSEDEITAKVQRAVVKKAGSWRFEPFQWQGKPAETTFTRVIDTQAVPTTSGGFALQVQGINSNMFPGSEFFPKQTPITYQAKHGQYLMVFRVTMDAQGTPIKVERASPDNRFPEGMDDLVDRKEETLKTWRQVPAIVDGTAVTCSRIYVMQTLPDRVVAHLMNDQDGWYSDIDLSKLLPKEQALVQAAVEATPDACPPPRFVTKIQGTLL